MNGFSTLLQAYMIEVGCETDFVARNEVMEDLSAKIVAAMKGMASTGAGVTDINVEELLNAPSVCWCYL